ncbi:DNA-3-methyladenine glycosylase I [Leptotrichia sp. OH3620_COT-345]|uniref:DNA-3-methyladenine glycosylase I n=1 Tax=Leptotrichia sp. OH3620_COT-345 TaxID=2491048 RepID=UPI000F64A17E|nr:DNA-3-methyladenine glycosylase I [Leptotrichia sp. OH3620_COT-345]RRD38900.1 DNA-3-methyladenine glycosylase I [Leptotrichia sp. OH3620_COT-345]
MKENNRCPWAKEEEDIHYHDTEWGVPSRDDNYMFEMLILEGFQAGLSWNTILKKRENFRKAFDNFNYKKISKYNQIKLDELMKNEGIIRNKLKINSAVTNAQAFIKIRKEYGSFSDYIWSFTNNKQIINKWENLSQVPATTELSHKISKELKKQGFKFVGSTIIYSFLQAIGIIDDHLISCPYKTKS